MATKDKKRPVKQAARQPVKREVKRPAKRPPRPTATRVTAVRRKPERRSQSEDPQIVYTQPPAFNKSGFLIRLATVAAVVLALTLGMSIFFKVEHVAVTGNEKYSAWDIREASGIQTGENLLTISKAMIGGKIITALPYVDEVRVGIKLPDTVNIEIKELDVAYAIADDVGDWWLIDSDGRVLDKITELDSYSYTRILGVEITGAQVGQQAVADELEEETSESSDPEEPTEQTTVPIVTVLGAERLQMAITIIQNLESNHILGAVTVVDVTSITQLSLTYEDRYEVYLGDSSQLDKKIRSMKEAVQQMTQYQNGKLDVSFTTWPDMVGFTPAEEEVS